MSASKSTAFVLYESDEDANYEDDPEQEGDEEDEDEEEDEDDCEEEPLSPTEVVDLVTEQKTSGQGTTTKPMISPAAASSALGKLALNLPKASELARKRKLKSQKVRAKKAPTKKLKRILPEHRVSQFGRFGLVISNHK
jgi:hypothetical protein